MCTKEIEKNLYSSHNLIKSLSKNSEDNVYRNYVLCSCLRLQSIVYNDLVSCGLILKKLDFSVIQPSISDILENQRYLQNKYKEYITKD